MRVILFILACIAVYCCTSEDFAYKCAKVQHEWQYDKATVQGFWLRWQ